MSHTSLRTSIVRAATCVAVAAPLALAVAPSASATTTTDLAKQVIVLVNAERKKVGCAPVRTGTALGTAARLHSVDMARYSYFSHTSRDGRSPWQRIRAAEATTTGRPRTSRPGRPPPSRSWPAWMNSTGHRRNILNCSNKAMGVGVARGGSYGIYWTQDFGTR